MEIEDGGYIRHFPKKQIFHVGDVVIAIKANYQNIMNKMIYMKMNIM